MKIQRQVSISNQNVSQTSEANANGQTQELQKEQQSSQVVASQKPLTETERNQRVSEFRGQEQLVRASLKQQVQETFPGLDKQPIGKPDQNMGGRPPGPRQLLADLRYVRRAILRDGEFGRFNREDLPWINREIAQILTQLRNREVRDAIRILGNAPQRDVVGAVYGAAAGAGPGSEGPKSDFSSDPMNPGGRGEQRPIMTGGGQQGGPSIGPQPSPGGTLNSPGGQGRPETGGPNQKTDVGGNDKDDGSNQGGKSTGGSQGGSNTGGGGVGPRLSDNKNYGKRGADADAGGGGGDVQSSGTTTSGGQPDDWDYVNDEVVRETEYTPPGLPPADDGGQRGDDVGGKLPGAKLPRGVTQQDADLVGSAFGTTTGADDKERPNTGGTSGTVAGDPMESRADDVGGRRQTSSGAGDIGISVAEELLKRLGLWKRPGGPDPEKR